MPGYKGPIFGRRTAARKIQSAWRRKKSRKRFQRDRIKTYGDVRKAVQATSVSSVIVQETNFALISTPTVQQNLSKIQFSGAVSRPNSRKSKQITCGHISFRCLLQVGDRTNLCRVMVVRNKNPENSATYVPDQTIFSVNNGTGAQPNPMFAEPNLREVEVKYDRVFNLQDSSESTPGVLPKSHYFKFSIPIRETWKYLTVADDGEVQTRNMKDYYLVAFSDSAILPNPSLQATSYTWFKNVGNTA